MTKKRILSLDRVVPRTDSPSVQVHGVPPANKAARLDDVILETVSNVSTPVSEASNSSRISSRSNLTSSISSLEPIYSPLPTSSLLSETNFSPKLGSILPCVGHDSSSVSGLVLSDSWEPRSTSTPAPSLIDDEGGVAPPHTNVKISAAQKFQNVLKIVVGSSTGDENKKEVLTKEELVSLASRFKDLCENEKKELLEYVKSIQVKNPQLVKSVRDEVMRNLRK